MERSFLNVIKVYGTLNIQPMYIPTTIVHISGIIFLPLNFYVTKDRILDRKENISGFVSSKILIGIPYKVRHI